MTGILITGADGFIGRKLCRSLVAEGHDVCAAVRRFPEDEAFASVKLIQVPDIGSDMDWAPALDGVRIVVHSAARVHVMKERSDAPLAEFRRVNVEGTRRLAQAAATAGVQRLVFLSTIKIHGESAGPHAFNEDDPPAPDDSYAVSKQEAESALFDIAAHSGLEVVILRPPLVYGEGVKGNFLSLMNLCRVSLPLPLGGIANRRSFIYAGNLVDIIIRCLDHPAAANQAFVVRDGEDVSTPELIRRMADALERPARLFSVPERLLRFAGKMTGKSAMVSRLLDSLTVDDGKIRRRLGWIPPFSMAEGLSETAAWICRPTDMKTP
ncbi:MAG: hypothetical protein A3G18_09230 [Rhodospirillales bacterium RIFCSPLOWO2_12_FULL_58_28]|nr:MAG: hypothetical protein A3H92_02450 [Rhodospirillales bacterium RIFCSPLOWO2_02_FULL_58_16]OHC79351.1 MAG: hypothetical protein A3G18_09230 [Rhodospirillales bacterium RIFCSPLOWO2_12_FULL_58_28]